MPYKSFRFSFNFVHLRDDVETFLWLLSQSAGASSAASVAELTGLTKMHPGAKVTAVAALVSSTIWKVRQSFRHYRYSPPFAGRRVSLSVCPLTRRITIMDGAPLKNTS